MELQVLSEFGIPITRCAVHVYRHSTSSVLSGSGRMGRYRLHGSAGMENPPTSWHSSGGPQEGRCLVAWSVLLAALPADATAEPRASSAAKPAKVLDALRECVHYLGLDCAILSGRAERRHLHPNF